MSGQDTMEWDAQVKGQGACACKSGSLARVLGNAHVKHAWAMASLRHGEVGAHGRGVHYM